MPLIRFGYFHPSSPDWEWVAQLDASKENLFCQANKKVLFILKKIPGQAFCIHGWLHGFFKTQYRIWNW